jgi:hypothetical protein
MQILLNNTRVISLGTMVFVSGGSSGGGGGGGGVA